MSDDLKILVTAGPTREAIDPVRFISNYSTGKMGYALVSAALEFSKKVFLISGPVDLPVPDNVDFFKINSAEEMRNCVLNLFPKIDILIMAAAVCDFRVLEIAGHKIKKEEAEELNLKLVRNTDILDEVGKKKERQLLVGFAAESKDLINNAQNKLTKKNLDIIIANDITKEGSGFAADTNKVTLIYKDGQLEELETMPKKDLAPIILERIYKYRRVLTKKD
jgi:phosphopantothenoylcysteine decarboxylase/phosphopantothenate--cysteine ligase